MNADKSRGQRLRQVRGKRNQQEFAELLGLSRLTISRYETGARVIDTDVLHRLWVLFRTDLVWLVTGVRHEDALQASAPVGGHPPADLPDALKYRDAELPQHLRQISGLQKDHLAQQLVHLLHGLPVSDACDVLIRAEKWLSDFTLVDIKAPVFERAASSFKAICQINLIELARRQRQQAYMAKAEAEGLGERVRGINGANACWPSLEQLEAEFGGQFVEQLGGVEAVGDAHHSPALRALDE